MLTFMDRILLYLIYWFSCPFYSLAVSCRPVMYCTKEVKLVVRGEVSTHVKLSGTGPDCERAASRDFIAIIRVLYGRFTLGCISIVS